ncbi:MAG: ankyrin repeat domain-containing protein [Magnetococcales bacterium]|nr:ankyrin repeat domain-containing protein [Magnetococcales bacterium]
MTCSRYWLVFLLLWSLAAEAAGGAADQTPLQRAAWEGDLDQVTALLDQGADPNARDGTGATALHFAVRRDRMAVIRLLLERGARTDLALVSGHTPLHLAVRKNLLPAARLLLDHQAPVNAPDRGGRTPLHHAQPAMLDLLLRHGADPNARNAMGRTRLHGAEAPVAQRLLRAGADPNRPDVRGRTPLYEATPETAALLLAGGGDITRLDQSGDTPLMAAVKRNDLAVATVLARGGPAALAMPDGTGWLPLHWNMAQGREEMALLLIQAGAPVNRPHGEGGWRPLHRASLPLAKALMAAGADPELQDDHGDRPLHWAAREGRTGVVALLVEGGVVLDAPNRAGLTPKDLALQGGHAAAAARLRGAGLLLGATPKASGEFAMRLTQSPTTCAQARERNRACGAKIVAGQACTPEELQPPPPACRQAERPVSPGPTAPSSGSTMDTPAP